MLERAKEVTRSGKYTYIEYARYADDLVILIDAHPHRLAAEGGGQATAGGSGQARCRDQRGEEPGRGPGARGKASGSWASTSAGFVARRGEWRAQYMPQAEEADGVAAEAQGDLPAISIPTRGAGGRADQPDPARLGELLRGWALEPVLLASSRDWVEQKVRRHLMRARERRGFGWERWSRPWLYEMLGLFNDYRVRRWAAPESAPSTIGPITLGAKRTGKPGAGKPPARFDVAGAGDVFMGAD